MRSILDYPVVYWSIRLLVMEFLLVITWQVIRFLAPTFRPSYIKKMWNADLPKGDEIHIGIPGFRLSFRFSKRANDAPEDSDRHTSSLE